MQDKLKRKIYCDFCQKASLPVFVQDWYLDTVIVDGQWDFVFVEENGETIAVLPYFLKHKFGFTYITMPIGIKFMGPFLLPRKETLADQHQIYEQLIEQLPKVHSFEQNFFPSVTNWLPFYWKGFQQTTRYTYRLNIEDPATVYRNFSEKTRYKIRKANKIVQISEDFTATQFHDIHQMTFDRQGLKTPFSLDLFLKFDDILVQYQARKMFFAVDNERNIHAALYIILDKDIAYMHFLGSNPAFPKSEAVNFLYWHSIQYLRETFGINTIDFQGGMMKHVENIFRRLRSIQIPYFSISKNESTAFKLLQRLKTKK